MIPISLAIAYKPYKEKRFIRAALDVAIRGEPCE
jgi:hypothetical protein